MKQTITCFKVWVVVLFGVCVNGDSTCLIANSLSKPLPQIDFSIKVQDDGCKPQKAFDYSKSPSSQFKFGYIAKQCSRIYALDLGWEFTDKKDFENIEIFIYDTLSLCMTKGIGKNIFINVLEAKTNDFQCCSQQGCLHDLNEFGYEDAVPAYGSKNIVWSDPGFITNYTTHLLDAIKYDFSDNRCYLNSFIFITNRIVTIADNPRSVGDLLVPIDYYCSSTTMIYIGEKDANTEALLQANYGKVFKDIYILPKSACVSSLNNCMSPCHTLNKDDCTSHTDFTTCVDPGVLPTAGNETLSVPDDLEKTQHVAYVFALSNSSKMEDYTILQKFIGLSVTSCFHHANEPISVILVTSHPKSKWEETAGDITNTIDQQPFESVIINITTYPTDQETTVTNEMILNAADFLDAAAEARGKRIVLMTDFISMKFYEDFKDSNKFISSGIEVDIYALNEDTFNFYKTNFSTNFRNVFNIEFHTNPPTMPIQICRIKPTEAPTTPKPKESADVALILIITCGTCAVLLIILCGGTVLYRQKINWIHRIRELRLVKGHKNKLKNIY